MRADFDYITNETSRPTRGRYWRCKKVYFTHFFISA